MALWFGFLPVLCGISLRTLRLCLRLCPPGAPFLAFFARRGDFPKLLANRYGLPQTGIAGEFRGLAGPLPGEVRVAASKVTISRGLFINRPPQIERFDNPPRRQLE